MTDTLTKDKREALERLLERVKGAKGPDREIDLSLMQIVDPGAIPQSSANLPYTASVDAALALVERELPGCFVTLEVKSGGQFHHCEIEGEDDGDWEAVNMPTPSLAILAALAALLSAKLQSGGINN